MKTVKEFTGPAVAQMVALELSSAAGYLCAVASAGRKVRGFKGDGVAVTPESLRELSSRMNHWAKQLLYVTGGPPPDITTDDLRPPHEED